MKVNNVIRWILVPVVGVLFCGGVIMCSEDKEQTEVTVDKDTVVKENNDAKEGDLRDARDFGNDKWRAVPHTNNKAWAPDDQPNSDSEAPPVQKRRRLRKRKRRPQPQVFSITEGESEDIEDRLAKRKLQQQQLQQQTSHRLDDVHEPWIEMEEEGAQRPSNRRRVSPVYTMVDLPQGGSVSGSVSATLQFGVEERKPSREEVHTATTTMPDLKTLLKQNGGQSLSEILQQRNLSLADLLRGQQEAILALTDRPSSEMSTDVISEYKNPSKAEEVKGAFKRIPPSVRKEVNRNYDTSTEESTENTLSKDVINAQRKRLSILYNKENKLYSDVTKYDVVTEATTEKRIFVPSHPKYYTSIDYRPDIEDVSDKIFIPERLKVPTTTELQRETTTIISTTTPIETTTIKMNLLSNVISNLPLRPKLKNRLPITSAKLKKPTSPMPIAPNSNDSGETIVPVKAIKIDIKDLYGFNTLVKANNSITDKGPLKMTIDLDNIIKTTQKPEVDSIQTNLIPDDRTTWTTEMETVTSAEKFRTVSAKDEIMEVLRDENTKEQLTKLLESRNMTIDELVEQRERGSSQRHLADIFHNKTREPESVEVHEGHIKEPMNSRNTPIDRQPKNTVHQEMTTSVNTISSIIDIKTFPSTKSKRIGSDYGVTSFPAYKIETDKSGNEPSHVPVWKSVYPTLHTDLLKANFRFGSVEAVVDQSNDLFIREMQQIDEIENTIAQAVNDEEDQIIKNQYDKEEDYFNIPYGVKSAIFASLAIIGISLIVFLTILVIFRWMQRHKKRLCYSDSFSCSRIKSPILDGGLDAHHRTLRTIMNETLGRKKNAYKAQLQSMSDSWDSDVGCGSGKSYK